MYGDKINEEMRDQLDCCGFFTSLMWKWHTGLIFPLSPLLCLSLPSPPFPPTAPSHSPALFIQLSSSPPITTSLICSDSRDKQEFYCSRQTCMWVPQGQIQLVCIFLRTKTKHKKNLMCIRIFCKINKIIRKLKITAVSVLPFRSVNCGILADSNERAYKALFRRCAQKNKNGYYQLSLSVPLTDKTLEYILYTMSHICGDKLSQNLN